MCGWWVMNLGLGGRDCGCARITLDRFPKFEVYMSQQQMTLSIPGKCFPPKGALLLRNVGYLCITYVKDMYKWYLF